MSRWIILIASVLVLQIATPPLWAAKIKATKGKKVLIDMEGDSFKKGDILKIENSSGKTVGLAKITKTKKNLAEALLKGKAEKGFTATLRPPKEKKSKSMASGEDTSSPGSSKISWGGMLGFNMASASIKLPTSGDTVALSGSGFSAKGLMDYPLFSWLHFRGMAGLEQFNVGGKNHNECSGACKAEIQYLSFDLWGRFLFSQGPFRPWVGAGFDLMFPMSKSTTALDSKSVTNTGVIAAGGGFDWMMSGASYVPVQVEYNLYPPSKEVTASAIVGRIGFATSF